VRTFFASYENLLDHCCFAWNRLIEVRDKTARIAWALLVRKEDYQVLPVAA
jgi:hypothetical protein